MPRVDQDTLSAIQHNFHAVIRGRAADLIDEHCLKLPELTPLLTSAERKAWFQVPGMAGGFSYWLEGEGEQTKLITESWSRVVWGSEQRHEVTAQGSRLVDAGFSDMPFTFILDNHFSNSSNRDDIQRFIALLSKNARSKAQEFLNAGDWTALNQLLVDARVIKFRDA
jgi:hypothetical protein